MALNNLNWCLQKYLLFFHITSSQLEFLWGKKEEKSDFLQFHVFLRWSDKFALDMSQSNRQTALLCHSHVITGSKRCNFQLKHHSKICDSRIIKVLRRIPASNC